MNRHRLHLALIALVFLSLMGAFAVPRSVQAKANDSCVRHKTVDNWKKAKDLEKAGFHLDLFGTGSVIYSKDALSLDLGGSATPDYAAARITETDNTLLPADRVKCWDATASQTVVAEFTVKFDNPSAPYLTEIVQLWNAPLGPSGNLPITIFGVGRTAASGGEYAAIVAQDLVFNPDFSMTGYLNIMPMPAWLDETQYHDVRITVTSTHALIEVQQGANPYTTVMNAQLPHAPEPVAFEVSVDNEFVPGMFVPVYFPDGIDIDRLEIEEVAND